MAREVSVCVVTLEWFGKICGKGGRGGRCVSSLNGLVSGEAFAVACLSYQSELL